jgi:2-oxoglutarate ferredoxin oxidoreductase subunit delta
MFAIKIDKEKCKSCGLCIDVCPNGKFRVSTKFNQRGHHYMEAVESRECNGCKKCVIICPDVAIEIYRKEDKKQK